ncbi:MAG: DUF502 domain-containing protein [Verrucomicrobiales bacterium]|nr:DUF502 domain-containing protein [Verrucomicrobiales bacterium]
MKLRRQALRWRADFFAGLAVVLPVVLSLAIVKWLFGTVSGVTDVLLYVLPPELTRSAEGSGEVLWYWSLMALLLTVALLAAIGRLARNFVGRKIVELVDWLMVRVPLLNKVYVTIKQVNEAFASSKRAAFKKVVLIQYPHPGSYSIAFLTSEDHPEVSAKLGRKMLGVFLPTTPNPTSGYLLVVPEEDVTLLDMSVAEGIKLIISLGSVVPSFRAPVRSPRATPELPTAPAGAPVTVASPAADHAG